MAKSANTDLKRIKEINDILESAGLLKLKIDRRNKQITISTEHLMQEDIDAIYYIVQSYETKHRKKLERKLRGERNKLLLKMLRDNG